MNKMLLFVWASILMACQSPSEQTNMKSVDGLWKAKATQEFPFVIEDSQNEKDLFLVVRNNNDYPYSNIRFIVNLAEGNGKNKTIDTVNYLLAQPNGEWLGSGFGETKEVQFQYKLNHKFPKNGPYKITISQAMRNDNLPGIEDIGIKIEQSKVKNSTYGK